MRNLRVTLISGMELSFHALSLRDRLGKHTSGL